MNILLILISVLLNCAAQLCIRKGMLIIGEVEMSSIVRSLGVMITNLWLWGAMISYAVSILLWIVVLSKVEVSFAYPFLSIGYVVAALVGYYFFGESLSLIRVAGIIIICVGVYLISRS
ncbi:DMT family transporter [uncultured Bacteroides sp.]|uniref:DMT family transporter n=1 Tax=uncultured Bacteroides sp. TaxID=162156 RepID=UPI000821AD95|nr:SMR family transporter [uncultured Bacteroides sp.]SCH60497.1 4-amino-4-deoxy-L-arabinose-phosphoundecaprenol flippase subunit ArnF [uncultured Bacteroides sp.]